MFQRVKEFKHMTTTAYYPEGNTVVIGIRVMLRRWVKVLT